MTYRNLLNAQEALARLTKQTLKVKEAVKVARLVNKLNDEFSAFNKARENIVSQDEEVEQKLTELIDTELEGEYEAIEIESDIDISVADIILMEGFITFKE